MTTTTQDRRVGPSGELANELVSVLTAVSVAADDIADAPLTGSWRTLQRLAALERALTQAVRLTRGLSYVLQVGPAMDLPRDVLGLRPRDLVSGAPVFCGRLSELVSGN